MSGPITIIKFRVFDKDLEKNFYHGETMAEIHKTLNEISQNYIPKEVITAVTTQNNLLDELTKHKQK